MKVAGVENLRLNSVFLHSVFFIICYRILNFLLKLFLAKLCLLLFEVGVPGDTEIAELGCRIRKVVPRVGHCTQSCFIKETDRHIQLSTSLCLRSAQIELAGGKAESEGGDGNCKAGIVSRNVFVSVDQQHGTAYDGLHGCLQVFCSTRAGFKSNQLQSLPH